MKTIRLVLATTLGSALVLGSCTEAPSQPEISLIAATAKGGGDVKVQRTDPASGEQSQRLLVRVIGSGFETGSDARWLVNGAASGDVVTHSTSFVSSRELVAGQ